MVNWITGLALALGASVAAWLAIAAYGASRWAESTRALMGRLEAARLPATASRYDARELEGLPAPVQRYFRAVLRDGQRIVTAVTVEHTGNFNVSQTGEQWKSFTSRQRVVTRRPGFVWDARVALMPGMAVHVHDAYVAGVGLLKPSVLGLYALADLNGEGEIARGELMRYFAEAAWYPTALLPSQGVQWDAVDDRSAKATLRDGALSLTMQVKFDNAGLIESTRFDARGATVGKEIVQTPWESRMSNYQERDGMRVPLTGEAAWAPPGARKPYWRGTIVATTYEFAPQRFLGSMPSARPRRWPRSVLCGSVRPVATEARGGAGTAPCSNAFPGGSPGPRSVATAQAPARSRCPEAAHLVRPRLHETRRECQPVGVGLAVPRDATQMNGQARPQSFDRPPAQRASSRRTPASGRKGACLRSARCARCRLLSTITGSTPQRSSPR